MTRKPRRRSSIWRIALLLGLIGVVIYINQVVIPTTPPLFIATPTPTQSPETFINQGEEFFGDGKLGLAINAYKEAINSDPANPANYVSLARLQVFAGEYDEAIENTQNALLQNPDNPLAHAIQGWALGFQEKYGESERALKKAIELDPNNALAHAYYAETLINQGDYNLFDKAIEESKKAQELDPNLLETHRARGIVLLNTQNVEESIDEFLAALDINKNIADLHLNLGVAYKLLENFDLAQESLLASYALNPSNTIAMTELSRSFFADGRFPQAAQYAEEAVKLLPSDPRLHGNLGIIYYKMEDYPKAIPALALAVRGGQAADGTSVEGLPLEYGRVEEYYWYLGFALARSNRCIEAVPVFQKLLAEVSNDEIAVYNANQGLEICKESLEGNLAAPTASETPEAMDQGTPTP